MSKVFKRADGTQIKLGGYRFAAPNPEIKRYAKSAARLGGKQLPPKVDLREHMTEVEHQGSTSSCVANAVAGAYEYLAKRHLGDDSYNVSRLFIYYNARYAQDWQDQDAGSFVGDAVESLKEYGACSEETWPFDEEILLEEPSEEAYAEAAEFLVEDISVVPVDLNAWKSALAEGYPIIFGIPLYQSFDKGRKGKIPMPTENEASREAHGGHSMLCVGYSDKDQVFIVRNSWGTEWGDSGYCYIPYGYLVDEKFNDGDNWIIRQLENLDFESTWSDDDESVLGDFGTELEQMTDEDYNNFLDALGDYDLEYRLAVLMLYAGGADELSDEEIDEIAVYLEETVELLGVDTNAADLLDNALEDAENEDLVYETIDIFGEYFSNEMLARIVNDIENIIGTDDIAEEEQEFIDELVETWQIEYEEE